MRRIRAHARRGRKHALKAILIATQRRRRATQHRLQDRASRARARAGTHLLVVEAHEHRDVAALRGPLRRETLQGHQARVHARQVVLARRRDELALVTKETRSLAGREDQVEGRDLRRVIQASRARHILQHVAVRVIHRPHRVQVLLRIQLQANRIHLTIQVNRQLRDTRNRTRTRQDDLAIVQNQAARQRQLAIQPRVPHHAAVHLDVNLAPAIRRRRLHRRLHRQRRRIRVCTHDTEARVVGDRLGHEPRGHRAAAHHHVSARGRVPRALLVDARKAGVHQTLRHDLGRVIGSRRIKKEMLIVHRVRVDLVQFKLCHTSHGRTLSEARPTIDT